MNKIYYISLFVVLTISNTVMAQDFEVPEWAKGVLWYQIFPERYSNGDPSNDPTLADIAGSWPHNDTAAWQISPWTSDWYEMQPWEKENGKNIGYQLQRRRYGGDLQGIINKLDYIEALGVGAIYLNPIFFAPSLHKYDAAMYHHVEPTFGPDPEGDRKLIATEDPIDPSTWHWTAADKLALTLIEECHKRNIKIIFDGVFNHVGVNNFAFQDVKKNQQNSKYADWFIINSWDDKAAGTNFSYTGWFGVPDLPEFKEDSTGIVAGPKQYIFDCTQRWMAPNNDASKGIDGWRLDVAFCVDHDFWKDWRKVVKSINPDAYLTAEVVDKPEVVKPYLYGDEFDAVMNYAFGVIASEFFINRDNTISVSEFDSLLKEMQSIYGYNVSLVMQNLFDSHDTQRFTSYLVNSDIARFRTWGEYFNKTKAENPVYSTRKPDEEDYKKQRLMALFQYTFPGAPMVYYGDEIGMWGANDPDCRKPMIWNDLNYNDEWYNWDGSKNSSPDKVQVNQTQLAYYKKLGELHKNKLFKDAPYSTIKIDDANGVYVYSRYVDNAAAIVIINNSNVDQVISFRTSLAPRFTDYFSGAHIYGVNHEFIVRCAANTGTVLLK